MGFARARLSRAILTRVLYFLSSAGWFSNWKDTRKIVRKHGNLPRLSIVSSERFSNIHRCARTLQDYTQFFTSVFGFCWVLSPSTSTPAFPYKSASSVHRRVHPPPSNASSPPPSLHPPSHPPPMRVHRFPPPPSSPPPPPPDEERSKLTSGKHSHNRRRLFSSEHVADPNSSSGREHSERNTFLTKADASPGKCTDADTGAPPAVTPLVPYGGGYIPVGAPFPYGDPGVPSPEPGPSPTSGVDGPSDNQPALPPVSGDNSTLAHTTMVSAMKLNQCTYTIITCTGNIEGAGTQADVNVEFFDKYGDSVLFVNLKSQNRNFNRGATDTFTVVGDCVQNICRMHLSHDDSGPNPGWFVNTVTVSLMYQTHVFNVFEWLAKDEPPYSLSRTVSSCPA
ncbi:hypothetical protein KC19_4G147600 [Ceratodon purpureus]|uniref:PLAT domain-containing protein n=1 Tax=Ceratodon purpureus TaxID=3225 RepID=A0A8T0I8Q3_CERPU|nr:hypothetical protein KC19_4G147600 [Ceratodon purpureus]